jgi:hypothetical protein
LEMDGKTLEHITESTQRLVAAAEALQNALMVIHAQQQEISAKVDKIVAAIEEKSLVMEASSPHPCAKRGLEGGAPAHPQVPASRKTLSPLVTSILAKNGVEDGADAGALDKALATLTPEQRIAVKLEMARAGILQ